MMKKLLLAMLVLVALLALTTTAMAEPDTSLMCKKSNCTTCKGFEPQSWSASYCKCGHKKTEHGAPCAHVYDYDDVYYTEDPTCQDPAYNVFKCTLCNQSKKVPVKDSQPDPNAHVWQEAVGMNRCSVCGVCKHNYVDTNEVVSVATCVKGEVHIFKCSYTSYSGCDQLPVEREVTAPNPNTMLARRPL